GSALGPLSVRITTNSCAMLGSEFDTRNVTLPLGMVAVDVAMDHSLSVTVTLLPPELCVESGPPDDDPPPPEQAAAIRAAAGRTISHFRAPFILVASLGP